MGAGKSTVARILAGISGTIIDADNEAKVLMQASPEIKKALIAVFGSSITIDGQIRFDILGPAAFRSSENILKLNAIVHPALIKLLEGRLQQKNPFIILDAALIPLWRIEPRFDRCIWVQAPFAVRLHRLQELHPGHDQASLENRMRIQEQVLPVPAGPGWATIDNCKGPDYLDEVLRRFR